MNIILAIVFSASLLSSSPQNELLKEGKRLCPYIVSSRINKVENEKVYLSKGVKDGFSKGMILNICSINIGMWLPYAPGVEQAQIATAKIISADENESVAHITELVQRTYEVWDKKILHDRIEKASIQPGDIAIVTYYDYVTKQELSEARSVLAFGNLVANENRKEFKLLGFACLLNDKTVIITDDKLMESILAKRFGWPLISRTGKKPASHVVIPNTEEFFEIMEFESDTRYSARSKDIKALLDFLK